MTPAKAAARKWTEREALDALRRSVTRPGNGGSGEFAFLTHVRNAAGLDATRTIDAVTVGLWPSRGFRIEGYEIKVSRSDWLRELADPAKADDAMSLVDAFTVVAPSGMVADGELPDTWGHITLTDSGNTRRVKAAPLLRPGATDRAVSRSVLVSMLRSAGAQATPDRMAGCASRREHDQAVSDAHAKANQSWSANVDAITAKERETRQRLVVIGNALGVDLLGAHAYGSQDTLDERVAKVLAAARAVVGDARAADEARERLARIVTNLRSEADRLEEVLGR